ncbi:hypothetical protein [Clostridium beijerinckii]|uniref:Uncharacterized protein n=2 Tax=Clostridium beijerinckii TaxID=1520 RepID=A0A1S9N136_CLOBE|nr:hypothetical protein [Clostridium beijerinckii]MZK50604.1 hypothetical protein [Clostridium beijerinckii]MZK58808.1 hypothetical protein [Clostridium beijerinckii]MZK68808.1 hypothetical protein [Clostridium beijerinckii]MZK74179.1 hypothetical protein [Clostridium beijerinckii]MZK82653.1 hypothetical protein [Clostridium beijerinckii]
MCYLLTSIDYDNKSKISFITFNNDLINKIPEELKEFTVQKETLIDDIDKILQWLEYEKKKRDIEFVHGIAKPL